MYSRKFHIYLLKNCLLKIYGAQEFNISRQLLNLYKTQIITQCSTQSTTTTNIISFANRTELNSNFLQFGKSCTSVNACKLISKVCSLSSQHINWVHVSEQIKLNFKASTKIKLSTIKNSYKIIWLSEKRLFR